MDTKLITRLTGTLLLIESVAFAVCFFVSLAYGDSDMTAFAVSFLIAITLGLLLRRRGSGAKAALTRYDSFVIVTVSWLASTLVGTLPYILSGVLPSLTDAFFETMSGFTTTGATMIDDIDSQPHGILFWRSLTNWVGGLGIVLFTLAILPSNGTGEIKLFAAEMTGPNKNKLHPRLKTTLHWLWSIYLLLTVLCAAALYLAGMGKFDSICHAFTTTATGGFSTHSQSIAYFNSPAIEYVETAFMFLSGINFSLLYALFFKRKFKMFVHNSELKAYALSVFCASAFIAVCLYHYSGYSSQDSVREALFHVVSIGTSTGFISSNFMQWIPATWIVLLILMFVGACAGSTSGGFKMIRVVAFLKITINEFKYILHPNAVIPIRINRQTMNYSMEHTLIAFGTLYILSLTAGILAFSLMGIPLMDAVGISMTSLGNSGPDIGRAYGMLSSWNGIPMAAKWLSSLMMLMGRLELFSIIILLTPRFWKDY